MSYSTLVRDEAPVVTMLPGPAAISAHEWNALVSPGGFYSSHAWVAGLAHAHGPSPVLSATSAGRLEGVVPTWTNADSTGLFSLEEMTRALPGVVSADYLWLGTKRSTANMATITRNPAKRARTLRALLEHARHLAARKGLKGVLWPYLSGPSAQEIASSHPLAHAVLHSADAVVKVPSDGMAGLESSVSSKERMKWRRERRIFRSSCSSVEWTSLSPDVCERVAPLLANTRDKYGSPGGTAWMRRTLSGQLSSGVARNAFVALARRGNDVTAAALFYGHGDWLYGRYWGASHAAPDYAYFALTHYEAVDFAAQHGFRRLHLSVPASKSKTSRGAALTPLALVAVPSGAISVEGRALTFVNSRHTQD
ncbi:hypothetical protein GCM10010306_021840 [Streptomyces umbrinus]|uniref:peptidogalycan biosysnthesis protein n=1 Tax=Streptomyces umbrinus TaxID=67370 RepID=UPI00167440DF|nr:GNAT family N-acetyltransferase [Streptomyces umbrinus]GHB29011.1 hypothetical protein GCM10010306_021840 [Streptomyces umbrinus]